MPKAFSIGVATAAIALGCGTASATAQLDLEPALHIQLAQVPGDPPVSSKRSVNLNQEDRFTIREIVLKDKKVQKVPESTKVAIGEAVGEGQEASCPSVSRRSEGHAGSANRINTEQGAAGIGLREIAGVIACDANAAQTEVDPAGTG